MIRVFPTEAVAKSHMRTWCKSNPGRAVFKDEFVSWDTFKRMCLPINESLRKAEYTDRRIFCEKILSDPSFVRKLSFFYNRDYEVSHRRFCLSIAKNLVFFKALEGKTLSSRAMENDAALLLHEYEKYLGENNLYEESYLTPDFSPFRDRAEIYHAHAIADPFVGKALESGVREVRIIEGEDETLLSPIHLYPNTRFEIRDVLVRIRELLNEGVRCSDIAVTLAGKENLPYFLDEASSYNIPIRAAIGKDLSSYNSGRFFSCLEQCVAQNWSFDSVKALLCDVSFPLKDRTTRIAIIRKAVEKKISSRNDWLSKLTDRNLSYMEGLIGLVEGFVRCDDASKMQILIRRLQDEYFEGQSWDSMGNELESSAFQRCVKVIVDLSSYGSGLTNLFSIFSDSLSNTVYVSSMDNGGVTVFSYPLSAGLSISHHFVLGLEDKNARIRMRSVPFDPEDQDSKDLTYQTLLSFSQSCENLYLCASEHSYHGYDSVPSEFIRFSEIIKVGTDRTDPFLTEKKAWDVGFDPSGFSIRPLSTQKRFHDNAELSVCMRRTEHTEPFELEKLSATAIDSYKVCPRKFYISKVLGIDESEYEIQGEDARVIGQVLHDALERHLKKYRYFSRCAKEDFGETLDSVLDYYQNDRRAIDALVAMRIRKSCLEGLEAFFSSGLEYFEDCVLVETEKAFEFEEQGVRIKGFVDCILRDVTNDEIFIIDFKKGYYRSDSVQLPLYAMALSPTEVKGCCYYVIRDSRFVFNEDLEDGLFDVQDTVSMIKQASETGSFPRCENIKDCSGCAFRSICRRGYVLR